MYTFIPGKFNSSDWLTRQYALYNLYYNNNDNYNNSNPKDGLVPINDLYISQVLSLLISTADETLEDTPLMSDSTCLALLTPQRGVDTTIPVKGSKIVDKNQVKKVGTVLTVDEMFSTVHGGVNFHRGVLQTWKDLNEQFPGHNIPHRVIEEKVAMCATCQKARDNMRYVIPEEKLSLKPSHYRQRIGIDTLTITPVDKNGNVCCIVVTEHFSKFADNSRGTRYVCVYGP